MVSLGPRQRAFLLSSPDQIFARFDGFTGPDAVVNQGIGSRHPLSSFLVPSLMPAKLCLSPLRFRFARRGIQPGGKSLGEGGGYSKRRRREIVGWKFGRGEGRGRRVAIVGSVGEREREGRKERSRAPFAFTRFAPLLIPGRCTRRFRRSIFSVGITVWGPTGAPMNGVGTTMEEARKCTRVIHRSSCGHLGGMRTTPKLGLPSFLLFFPPPFLWRHLTLSRRLQCTLLDNAGPQSAFAFAFARCDFDVLTFFPFSPCLSL